MAGNLTVESCANVLNNARISANYGIGTDGRVGLYVDETNRAWTSANKNNDNQAITIEVANDGGAPDWHVSDKALAKLIDLCTDICKRNGIRSLNYTGDASGNLTRHNMFMATACPGPYLQSKFPYIAEEINKRLAGARPTPAPTSDKLYRVQVGAFSIRANADRKEAELNALGYPTYMVTVGDLYKVQTGAFSKRENADRLAAELKGKGFQAFVTTKSGSPAAPVVDVLKAGDKVKVQFGSKDYNGRTLADFVYRGTYDLQELSGDRAVIGIDGRVTAAIDVDNLYKA